MCSERQKPAIYYEFEMSVFGSIDVLFVPFVKVGRSLRSHDGKLFKTHVIDNTEIRKG